MSLYDEIGGKAAVDAAVDVFYEKVLADPTINGFFSDIDMTAQRRKQKAFFTILFRGESDNTDAYMRKAHAKLVAEDGLSDAHFDAVAGHLNATLEELSVKPELIETVMTTAAGMRDAVLNR